MLLLVYVCPMASILCIDTATEICSVALGVNGNIVASKDLTEPNQHASKLTPLIEEVLALAGKTLKELDAVAVSKGPGSYTGLRVGVSTAKGLCYALEKPLISVPTLLSLSVMALQKTNPAGNFMLLPMIDARRMEVYCAVYNQYLNEVEPTRAEIVTETSFAHLHTTPLLFFGNGAAKCRDQINMPGAQFIADITCSALGMVKLAEEKFLLNDTENVAYFEPYYLKDFVGTTPKK